MPAKYLDDFYGDIPYKEVTTARTVYCGKSNKKKFSPQYFILEKKPSKFNQKIWGDIDELTTHWSRIRNIEKIKRAEYGHEISDTQWCSIAGLHNVMLRYGEKPILDMIQLNGGSIDSQQVSVFDLLK